jgi:uncharacterized protein (DUF58 family)
LKPAARSQGRGASFRFAPDFRTRLIQLAQDLMHARGVAGDAGRRGRMPGRVEFRDHRAYAPGDDVRFLDWNVFLRSGVLAVKTFTQDEAPEVTVLLDRSASMGPPGSRQDLLAREIAAGLGFLGLRSGGEAILEPLGGDRRQEPRRFLGPRSVDAWLAEVEAAPDPSGPNRLDAIERTHAPARPGRVVAWVSDFLIEPLPAGAFAALARAGARRFAFIACAHVDALAATRPGAALRLGDPEGARTVAVRHDAAWSAAFHDVRAEHVAAVTALAARHQFTTVAASAESTFEACLMDALGA